MTQDTFIDTYTNLSKFENLASFKTWIIKIMLNNCFRKLQKFSFKNEVVNEISDKSIPMFSNQQHANANTNKTVVNKELSFIIENALKQVPFYYRIIFSLREINGLNVLETAEVLNVSQANVKVRLNRAKAMLRKQIEKSYTVEDIFEFNLKYCDAITSNVMNKIKILNE